MWAQHCLAHVYGQESRVREGIDALAKYAPDWTPFGQYIQSHNWFHLAVLDLSQLDFGRVLDAYQRHIWGFQPDEVVEHTDAILLLWYVELAGGDAGARWREIAADAHGHLRLLSAPASIRAGLDFFGVPSAGVLKLSRRLRAAFDPGGVFNPGCFIGGI